MATKIIYGLTSRAMAYAANGVDCEFEGRVERLKAVAHKMDDKEEREVGATSRFEIKGLSNDLYQINLFIKDNGSAI